MIRGNPYHKYLGGKEVCEELRNPNGYESVTKMSGKRRRPWIVRVTTGYDIDAETGTFKQKQETLGYAATRAEGMQMLAAYNMNPFDIRASKITFRELYEQWSAIKYPTVSKSNVHGYEASYKVCGMLYDRVFKDIRLADLQHVVDTCGKNYPTLKKLKGLFNQLYEYERLLLLHLVMQK